VGGEAGGEELGKGEGPLISVIPFEY